MPLERPTETGSGTAGLPCAGMVGHWDTSALAPGWGAGGHARTPRAVQHKASRPWLGNRRSPHSSPSRSRGREKAGAQGSQGPPQRSPSPWPGIPGPAQGAASVSPWRAPSPQLPHRVLANASEHGVLNPRERPWKLRSCISAPGTNCPVALVPVLRGCTLHPVPIPHSSGGCRQGPQHWSGPMGQLPLSWL